MEAFEDVLVSGFQPPNEKTFQVLTMDSRLNINRLGKLSIQSIELKSGRAVSSCEIPFTLNSQSSQQITTLDPSFMTKDDSLPWCLLMASVEINVIGKELLSPTSKYDMTPQVFPTREAFPLEILSDNSMVLVQGLCLTLQSSAGHDNTKGYEVSIDLSSAQLVGMDAVSYSLIMSAESLSTVETDSVFSSTSVLTSTSNVDVEMGLDVDDVNLSVSGSDVTMSTAATAATMAALTDVNGVNGASGNADADAVAAAAVAAAVAAVAVSAAQSDPTSATSPIMPLATVTLPTSSPSSVIAVTTPTPVPTLMTEAEIQDKMKRAAAADKVRTENRERKKRWREQNEDRKFMKRQVKRKEKERKRHVLNEPTDVVSPKPAHDRPRPVRQTQTRNRQSDQALDLQQQQHLLDATLGSATPQFDPTTVKTALALNELVKKNGSHLDLIQLTGVLTDPDLARQLIEINNSAAAAAAAQSVLASSTLAALTTAAGPSGASATIGSSAPDIGTGTGSLLTLSGPRLEQAPPSQSVDAEYPMDAVLTLMQLNGSWKA
ncbi:hypothetical protein BGW38_006811 [Lunasporangiospora selenospora]|uniref:Uncharacterized protein n=1 Tax=Lunasporangiospora selenospora TaxID=979761 RepID=A0A9P6KI26_9FUNG|nr:hypothetical protein BGW38_006811 [Lunasporangiospora selenospora]